jgi:cbb3-type cytochrome oxidase maturation protein
MSALLILIPAALLLGGLGLLAFFWAQKHDQFDDLDGAAHRILMDDSFPQECQSNDEEDDSKK